MRQCEVFVHDQKAGVLKEISRQNYEFDYDRDYRSETKCSPSQSHLAFK
jgi:HipA-like protein